MTTLSEHQTFATTNFSLSGASGLYDRARPSYPAEAISLILSKLPPNATVLELGAGTGLFTRGLLTAAAEKGEGTIKKLRAIEPSEGMRKGFEKGLEAVGGRDADGKVNGIEVTVEDGTFERIPAEEGEADLVVIAQAFHWMGHNGSAAVNEIARVLKPQTGVWAKIWNLENGDAAQWVAELRNVYEEFEAGTPQYRHGYWKSIWKLEEFPQLFTAPEEHHVYTRTLPTNEDLVVDRAFSKSYITALSSEDRAELEEKLREIVRRGDGKEWIDEKEGTFHYPYATDLFLTTRK
ncbi:hypothetical protein JCM8097_003165 [Rhodosporidiobolus ruineniae]